MSQRLWELDQVMKKVGITETIETPALLRGLMLVEHKWVDLDGAILVNRGNGAYTAYYQLTYQRDKRND